MCFLVSWLLCLPYLSCLFTLHPFAIIYTFSFHRLSVGFLVFAFLCTHMGPGRDLLGVSKKGKDVSKWSGQATAVSRFRVSFFPLVMYSFKPPPPSFLLPFSLRWYLLGISCLVPFILIFRVWRPLFTFLHLYFGLCSRDVGIYSPTLCACIVHDECIYIPAWLLPMWLSQSVSPKASDA